MYVIVNKISQKCYVFKYAVDVIKLISCNKNTITNNKSLLYWSYKEWIIYNPVDVKTIGKQRGKSFN